MKPITLTFFLLIVISVSLAQKKYESVKEYKSSGSTRIIPGAERINVYLPLIKGKRVGIFANQTSTVGNTNLVDTLRKLGIGHQSHLWTRTRIQRHC